MLLDNKTAKSEFGIILDSQHYPGEFVSLLSLINIFYYIWILFRFSMGKKILLLIIVAFTINSNSVSGSKVYSGLAF